MKNSMGSHKQALIACFAFVLMFSAQGLHTQSYSYPMITMSSDTIWQTFPPPDSTYIHNRLVMKFRRGVLDNTFLCYYCDDIITPPSAHKGAMPQTGPEGDSTDDYPLCKQYLMSQHFPLETILDPVVQTVLMINGASYLMRMTPANPCADTLSLSRIGDTIPMDDFDWMVVYFDNDTSVVRTLEGLYLTYNGSVIVAEPDYLFYSFNLVPGDPEFSQAPQRSLTMIGMTGDSGRAGAWDFNVGNNSIIIAVVDGGVDYWRCDLGAGIGKGKKVIGGWDFCGYLDNCPAPGTIHGQTMQGIFHDAIHGTQVASIIASLTNNRSCYGKAKDSAYGMAGIGGGWDTIGGGPNLGIGLSLLCYNCKQAPGMPINSETYLASAILEAVASSINGHYGYGVDVVNASWGRPKIFSSAIRNAVAMSFYNASSFVAANGETNNDTASLPTYPTQFEPPNEVIVVGGADHTKIRKPNSNWSKYVDILAPAGVGGASTHADSLDLLVRALQLDGLDDSCGPSGSVDSFGWFYGTSAAAPHVSGVVGLLRGWLKNQNISFLREDPEGILKSSALDINPTFPADPNALVYLNGFDSATGFGFLQADNMFHMLDPAGSDAYKLAHFEIPYDSIQKGAWKSFGKLTIYDTTSNYLNPFPANHVYSANIREITGSASYADSGFDAAKPLYTWGNSGNLKARGKANMSVNFGEPWCEVMIDSLNRDLGNGIVPGIRHNYSTTVRCHTYQFELLDTGGHHLTYYPKDSSLGNYLGLGFTVFGATKFSSRVSTESSNRGFEVWPTIASNIVNVLVGNSQRAIQCILVDAIGRQFYSEKLEMSDNQFEIATSNLPSGLYFICIQTETGMKEQKFIVQH